MKLYNDKCALCESYSLMMHWYDVPSIFKVKLCPSCVTYLLTIIIHYGFPEFDSSCETVIGTNRLDVLPVNMRILLLEHFWARLDETRKEAILRAWADPDHDTEFFETVGKYWPKE